MDLTELIKRDSVTGAWFWITSIDAGPYAENEQFDATFVRETGEVVGGGYLRRQTFHIQGITTAQVDSRRENGGRIVRPELTETLAQVITDADRAAQYDSFREWAEGCQDMSLTYQDALTDFEEWEINRARHPQIVAWLGDAYDEYVKAAEKYLAEH
jgi:hypothetical protein